MRLDEPPDDEAGADVIELRPGQDIEDDARHIVRDRRAITACGHTRVRLDPDARRVYCRGCDIEVPAYDYLVTLAAQWERFIENRREAERRMKVARANLDELLRDERNAKSRRRSWTKREPDAVRHLRAVMDYLTKYRTLTNPTLVAALEFLRGDDDEARPEVDGAA